MTRKVSKRRPAQEQDKLIFTALRESARPVSAYEIIDQLRDRAGSAHRLESLNAFVACCQSGHQGAAVFAICENCGTVTEFAEPRAVDALAAWAKKSKYTVRAMTLELRGRCAACSAQAA
jgi:Fur family zinc uptake transcriptional regulator